MNIIKERGVWIVLFLMILSGVYYKLFIDIERVVQMEDIEKRDDSRIGDITEVKELYRKLKIDPKQARQKRVLQERRG